MIFRTPAGEVAEDRAAPGWWLARPRADATFTAGFRDRFLALSWLQAAADADRARVPRPRLPAASTGPLFAAAPYAAWADLRPLRDPRRGGTPA